MLSPTCGRNLFEIGAYFFQGSANPQHQEMWRRISANPESNLINGYEEGVTAILQGGGSAGIVIEEKSAETYTSMNCALYTVGNLLERSYALGFRRGGLFKTITSAIF